MSRLVVVVDPAVGVGPKELAGLWLADEEASALGVAGVEAGRDSFVPGLVEMVVVPLVVNVASSLLYDLVRRLIRRGEQESGGQRTELELVEQRTAAGDRIIVVRLVQERL
ncbi:hypothetical protein [Rhizocola hellebori]|nr:hypothetical protein [Rhizocola hellebori]